MQFNNNKPTLRQSISRIDMNQTIVYLAFIVTVIFFSILLPGKFLTVSNILNISMQTAMISIMAVGMTFVIATGQIDLSIGSITAVSALVVALLLRSTGNIFVSVVVALIVGCIIGFINGVLVTQLNIPSFLVTLGTMGIFRGFSMWVTSTQAVPINNNTFTQLFGLGTIFGIPVLLYWTVAILALGLIIMKKTAFGKKVLAVGGNDIAANYSGINIARTKTIVMMFTAVAAAFAGILYAGRLGAGRYTFGEGDELSVIAAVILGGTSMAGGTANVFGSVVGSILVGIINNGLIIGGLSVSQQMMVRGAIVIFATALGNRPKKNK